MSAAAPESERLVRVMDELAKASEMMHVAYMAASFLDTEEDRNVLQTLLHLTRKTCRGAIVSLDEMRVVKVPGERV